MVKTDNAGRREIPKPGAGAAAGAAKVNGAGETPGAGAKEAAGAGAAESTGTGAEENPEAGVGTGAAESFFRDPQASTPGAGEEKRKPGRPKGSRSHHKTPRSRSTTQVQASLEGIEGILLSLHLMASTLVKIPELQLSEDEAKQLADASARVAVLYDFGASEKTLAWLNLAACCGNLYGTRAIAYHLRTKAEAEAKRAPAPIIPFAPSPFSNAPNMASTI